MELYQLRSFAAVAESGHLTRAAEILHISQPALSAQIKALEVEFEVALFERTPTGMRLTAAGKKLLPEAEKTLHAAQALRHEAQTMKGAVARTVTVGTLSDPEIIRLGAFVSDAMNRYPMLQVQFHHEVSGAAFEHVRDGRLDASFYYGALSHPSVSGLPLREIAYRVAAPGAWANRITNARWEAITDEPWILAPAISTHFQLAQELFRAHGALPTKIVEADNEAVIGSLVLSGLGLALMREELALEKEAAGEVCLWRDARLATTLQFIYLKEREHDPAVRALLNIVMGVWNPGHWRNSARRVAHAA
jgi:DNA-binding transcriptional LysR family regulator